MAIRFLNIIQGLFVRLIFTVSSIIAVWRVVTVSGYDIYWLILFFNVLLYVEAIITFTHRKSGEWKWRGDSTESRSRSLRNPETGSNAQLIAYSEMMIQRKRTRKNFFRFCPSVFIYLLMSIPCTWILEMYLLYDRIDFSQSEGGTELYCASSEEVDSQRNLTSLDKLAIQGYDIDIGSYLRLSDSAWSLGLQQVLLFVLIIGRWLLPKGDLTRDQLSQLLLVYIGIAADILEFSTEGLKMKATRCNALMVWCILGIWSWSLMQFTLGLTVTKARKPRVASSRDMEPRMTIMCCETEVWGILATVVMQDGPFLALRLYVLITLDDSISQMMIFFTCKNTLVVLLQFYRLLVVFIEKPGHNPNSIIGKIQRYRQPGLRYHSGENNSLGRGMGESASTTKLLSIDGDASTAGHLLPLLPTDNMTADGRLRHSVNMANAEEIYSHTPRLPLRFPNNDTAFVIGKTLPNDVPVRILPDELGVPDSPTNSHSDYDNLQTPLPNENGDIPFMVPDFPELASVYDSDEEAARKAEQSKKVDDKDEEKEEDQDGTGKKKGKKKKTKEEKKKEKEEKRLEEERKKEEKKREKEDKKREEERKKEEKKKEEERKKLEKKMAKDDKRKESRKESRRGSKKEDSTNENKENSVTDDQKESEKSPPAADIEGNITKSNQSKLENVKEEDDPPPIYTPLPVPPPSYSPPSTEVPPPPPPPPPKFPDPSSRPRPPKFPDPKAAPPRPPQSPPKSPPGSPSIVSLDDM